MAVEIVGEAADQKLRVNCGNCSAVLEYVRDDIQSQTPGFSDYHWATGPTTYFIKCPRCYRQVPAKR